MKKKCLAVICAVGAIAGLLLTGCSSSDTENAVSVQSVSMIAGIGSAGLYEQYAGLVVSQNEVKIEKDANQTVLELKVNEGDEVTVGQVLFTYDTQAASLNLEKAQLEAEQAENSIASQKEQKSQLEQEKESAPSDQQLSYSIEIQSLEADILQAEYNLTVKQKEIDTLKASMENSEVTATVNGRIKSICESGTDSNGNAAPYITILESGSYRVKGMINENSKNALTDGMSVIIRSRTDDSQTWNGTIGSIDWDSPTSNSSGYYSSDEMSNSNKYPFYVDLDSTDGLMLGQHVYIEPDMGQNDSVSGITLPSYYINDADSTSPWVWAANSKDKLEKRSVTVGAYIEASDSYVITDGISADDYLAFPEDSLSPGMPVSRYDENSFADGNDGDSSYNSADNSIGGTDGTVENGIALY